MKWPVPGMITFSRPPLKYWYMPELRNDSSRRGAVPRAVQRQGRHGDGAGADDGLVGAHLVVHLGGVVAGAVVAQRRRHDARLAEGGADALQRLGGYVPLRRCPAPPAFHEGVVVMGDDLLGFGPLEEEPVPGAPQVLEVHAQFAVNAARRDGHQLDDLFRREGGGSHNGAGAPVVADEIGAVGSQCADEFHGVAGH